MINVRIDYAHAPVDCIHKESKVPLRAAPQAGLGGEKCSVVANSVAKSIMPARRDHEI